MQYNYWMPSIKEELSIFLVVANMFLHKMADIEKGSEISCVPSCGKGSLQKVTAPYLNSLYTVHW